MSKSRAPPGQRPQRQLTSMHEFRGFRCRELHLLCCWGRDSRGGGRGGLGRAALGTCCEPVLRVSMTAAIRAEGGCSLVQCVGGCHESQLRMTNHGDLRFSPAVLFA